MAVTCEDERRPLPTMELNRRLAEARIVQDHVKTDGNGKAQRAPSLVHRHSERKWR